MAEKVEVRKTLKYEPFMSVMVVEAGELERGLNKALNPLIKGYRGCRLEIVKQQAPGGLVIQVPRFIISIDKFSDSVGREMNAKMAFILGSRSSFSLKDSVKDVLKNFIIEDEELVIREKQKAITITLNFFKCMQQIFEDNMDYRIKYDHVDYQKTRFNPEVKRYVWLNRIEGSMRNEFDKLKKSYQSGNDNNFMFDADYENEDEDDDDDYNTEM